MNETEITVEVLDNLDQTIQTLLSQGFEITREFDMTDYYFSKDSIETLQSLDYKDLINHSFLVRKMSNPASTTIMFKSKVFDNDNNVISEEKIKCKIDNMDDAIKIFNLSGLTQWCDITQHMLIFKKDKIHFALQIIEDLGIFIEYEEQDHMKDLSEQEKIDTMLEDLHKVGLNLGNDFSCKKVYMKFKKDKNF